MKKSLILGICLAFLGLAIALPYNLDVLLSIIGGLMIGKHLSRFIQKQKQNV